MKVKLKKPIRITEGGREKKVGQILTVHPDFGRQLIAEGKAETLSPKEEKAEIKKDEEQKEKARNDNK